MATDLRSRTISGVSWSALSQVVTQAFTFGIGIVVSRALGPKVYGLIGMISVFTGFASIFGDLGLGPAIIQRKELEPRHLNAAFWVNVAMGTTTMLVVAALGPVLAHFYHEPQLTLLTVALSLTFLLDSLKIAQIALLNREIRFKSVAKLQIASTVSAGLVGLALALRGFGPWSLVVQTLSGSVVALGLLWHWASWRPELSFDFKAAKDLLRVSTNVMGFNLVNYWARSLDNLLVGRFVGAAALGAYDKAYTLMLLPLTQVSSVVGRVMFPALSAIQGDRPKVKRTYLKAISIIALVTFPMMTGLFAVSDHLVLALLGDAWAPVIPILRLFCWVGLIQSIGTTCGWIYLSQGETGLYFTMGLITSAVCILAFVIGIHWGVTGVAWGYFLFNLVEWFPLWTFSGRIIGIRFGEMVKAVSPPFFCAVAMAAAVRLVGWLLPGTLPHWKYLVVQLPIGAVSYVLLIILWKLKAWREACDIFAEPVRRRLRALGASSGFLRPSPGEAAP